MAETDMGNLLQFIAFFVATVAVSSLLAFQVERALAVWRLGGRRAKPAELPAASHMITDPPYAREAAA